jgi:hypothetical protein
MAEKTTFAGLTRLAPTDSLSEDNFAFQDTDRLILDQLLRVGAVTHIHDGHAALADPTEAPTIAAADTGGTIPAEQTIYAAYSLVDAQGGETLATDVVMVTTQPGLAVPDDSPTLAADTTAGTLLAGSYSYAVTVTDGSGGESGLGPTATIVIPAGSATNQIDVSGLAQIVTDNGGTGYRLWRSVNGGEWTLINTGTTDTVTDDGSLCPDCGVTPPDGTTNLTNGTNAVTITIPAITDPAAISYRVYASQDPLLGSPSLVGTFPVATTDPIDLTTLDVLLEGSPPASSLALPGAMPIDARTEITNLRWLFPVADDAARDALTGVEEGSVVLTLADEALNVYDATGVWGKLAGGAGGGGSLLDVWQGAWDGSLAYTAGDVVHDAGSSWLALVDIAAPTGGGFTPITVRLITATAQLSDGVEQVITVTPTDPLPQGGGYPAKMVQFEVDGAGDVTINTPAPAEAGGQQNTELKDAAGNGITGGNIGTWTATLPSAGMYALFLEIAPSVAVDVPFHVTVTSATATVIDPAVALNDAPVEGTDWTYVAQAGDAGTGGAGVDATAWHWAGIYDPATAYAVNSVVAYRAVSTDPYELYFTSTAHGAGSTPDPATAGWWKLGDIGAGATVTPGHIIVGQTDDGAGTITTNVELPTRDRLAFTGSAIAEVSDATTITVNVDAPSTDTATALAAGGAGGPKPIDWDDIPLDAAFHHAIDITPGEDVYRAQCMLDVNGFVHLRGRVTTAASGAALLGTLPELMRPAHLIRIPHVNNGGTDVTTMSVFANGEIHVTGFSAELDLDGVHFYSEKGALGTTPITPVLAPGVTPDATTPMAAHGGPKSGTVTGCVNAASPAAWPLVLGTLPMNLADATVPSEYSQFAFSGSATYTVTAGPDAGQSGTLDVTFRLIDLPLPGSNQASQESYVGDMQVSVSNPSGTLTDMASDTIHICLDDTYQWFRVHVIA